MYTKFRIYKMNVTTYVCVCIWKKFGEKKPEKKSDKREIHNYIIHQKCVFFSLLEIVA